MDTKSRLTPEERRERARLWQHEHRRKLGIPERIKRTPEERLAHKREQARLAAERWRRQHGAKPAIRLPPIITPFGDSGLQAGGEKGLAVGQFPVGVSPIPSVRSTQACLGYKILGTLSSGTA